MGNYFTDSNVTLQRHTNLHQLIAKLDLSEEVGLHLRGILEDGNIKLAAHLGGLLGGVAF